MENISFKWFILSFTIFAVFLLVCVAAWQNWGGIGTMFQGAGGVAGSAIIGVLSVPFNWALSGGGPTIIGGWVVIGLTSTIIAFVLYKFVYQRFIKKPKTTANQYQIEPSNNIPITTPMQSQPTQTNQKAE